MRLRDQLTRPIVLFPLVALASGLAVLFGVAMAWLGAA